MKNSSIEKKRLAVPLEIKSDVDEEGNFTGYGAVFGNEDSYRDVVEKGAFIESLAEWKSNGLMPALLWQHNPNDVIGAYTELREDENGLIVKGQIALGVQKGKEAYELLKMKAVSGLSIGFSINEFKYNEDDNIRTLTKLDLWEVSLVTFPANSKARITDVKDLFTRGELPTERDFELFLRDAGISRSAAKGIISKGYKHVAGLREADSDIDEIKQALNKLALSIEDKANDRSNRSDSKS